METKEKIQGIFIDYKIWTILNLSFNEKLILSDIYKKNQLNDFKGYIKKPETLAEETGINKNNIDKALKNLREKGYITSNTIRKKYNGQIKTVINYRNIKFEALNNAERFQINEDNKFYSKNKEGIFISFRDLQAINSWSRSRKKDSKISYKKIQLENLILFFILQRSSFYDDLMYCYLARFKKLELSEFLGISRQSIYGFIEMLLSERSFNLNNNGDAKTVKGNKLYKIRDLGVKKIFNLLEELEEINIEHIDYMSNDDFLYIINTEFLKSLNLDFDLFIENSYI